MTIDSSALNQFIGNAAFSNGPSNGRGSVSSASGNSWYEAMSRAWGSALDGGDQPSNMVQLTAASLKMQFMSNNAATSQNATGQALETLGKRQ